MLDNYYPNRPDCLEKVYLLQFLTDYDYQKKACADNHLDCLKLKNEEGYIHKRKSPQLISLPKFNPSSGDKELQESYFHQILFKSNINVI